jgi:Predicted hydrolases or acyltransferases (alpha/beta hydrolase superfamily)
MPYLQTTDGTRLAYSDWGTADGTPVVFVHGWAMGADMWEYQVIDLTERGFRCITYDQRGCGRSDHVTRGYDFATLADDLAALLAHLDVYRVTLVGFSLGGGVIARYLKRHGAGRVARVAMIATVTPYLLKADDNPDGMDPSAVYDGFVEGLHRDRPHLLESIAPAFFGAHLPGVAVSPAMMSWAVSLCHQSSPVAMLEMYHAACKTDLRPDVAAVPVPALVIHGDSDPFAPAEGTGRRTADLLPDSQFVLYENAAHGLFITHRDRLSRDLDEFASP